LEVPVERAFSSGPGLTEVRLTTDLGEIVLSRADESTATLSRFGQPDQTVALGSRSASMALAEELRRLDADEIYASTARHLRAMIVENGARG
jgi:glucose-6-phosphate dehydrogenase assembly protein OpcA